MSIKDQERFRELESELRQLQLLAESAQFLSALMGVDMTFATDELRANLEGLEEDLDSLTNKPDRFNALFGPLGWIATERISLPILKEALALGASGDVPAGEQILEDYFNSDAGIDFWLPQLLAHPLVQPRRSLLLAAWEDHLAGRYHATVPVVLAQIDGITWDVAQKTFYARGKRSARHLQATESVVGDPSALARLAQVLSEKRSVTTVNPVDLPYRHGVLHGRDIGYANLRASTKAWATLLALEPWIRRVESGEQHVSPTPVTVFDPDTATAEDILLLLRKAVEMALGSRELASPARSPLTFDKTDPPVA